MRIFINSVVCGIHCEQIARRVKGQAAGTEIFSVLARCELCGGSAWSNLYNPLVLGVGNKEIPESIKRERIRHHSGGEDTSGSSRREPINDVVAHTAR